MPPVTARDNPDHVLDATLDPRSADLLGDALAVVRALVPAWSTVHRASSTVITGGITNVLHRLDAPGKNAVLVRIYGPNTDVVIDRERENRIFASLSAAGFAPPYLGRFHNGRVEGFLDGFRPLQPAEMGHARWRRGIGTQLAKLHHFAPPTPQPRTLETLRGWLTTARRVVFEGQAQAQHKALQLDPVAARLDELEDHLNRHILPSGPASATRAVLAHNDLLSGNVLVDDATGDVRFIDYEYGDCGYAAFDLANHFCEHAGFDSNFATGFPTASARADCISAYLDCAVEDPEVVAFDRVVRFFVLVDHIWWAAWAVVQARHSPIDFDFMGYAGLRLKGLQHHEDAWGRWGS